MRIYFLLLWASLEQGEETAAKDVRSKMYYNQETQTIVGFYCTWEDGWCDGWHNIDFTHTEDYVPSKVCQHHVFTDKVWSDVENSIPICCLIETCL